MSRIFRMMYQVADLGAPAEEREAAWRLTLEALRHPEQEEELLQQAIPPTEKRSNTLVDVSYQGLRGLQVSAGAVAAPVASGMQRGSAFLCDATFHLVRRLFLAAGDSAPRAVVFCAVEEGNAHNWIGARVAERLACHTGSPVCMVDANLADPSLHTYFGVEKGQGLAKGVLEGGSILGCARAVDLSGVHLISAGALARKMDSDALVTSGCLDACMSELRAGFGHVVVHAPPAGGNGVTSYLAALTDGVVLVVQPGLTPQRAAREAKEDIEAAGGRLLGVVLWRRPLLSLNRMGSSQRAPKPGKNS